jgi:oligopeptide transport system substrate-binding protein
MNLLTRFRRSLAASLLAAVVFSSFGCGRHETRVAAGTRDQVLHLGNGAEPKDLDPNTQVATIEYNIMSALFEGLVVIAGDGETILPGVAERWEISPDGLVYTFHLRSEARWSDGAPVTADDFLFSFRRVFTPSIAAANADVGYAIAGASDFANGKNASPDSLGLRAVDARTFEIRLAHPAPYLFFVLGGAPFLPVPRHVVERHGGATRSGTPWTRPGNLVSNGCFVLKSWQPQVNVTVAKNPQYWDRAHVRLNEVRFYGIESTDSEERAYRAGELHLTYGTPLNKLAGYRGNAASPLHVTPMLWTNYAIFNTTRPPFDRLEVRRAFALAIDRERLVFGVLHESGSVAHAMTRPGTGGYSPPVLPDHDPAEARRLLAKAGYPGGAGLPKIEFLMRSGGAAVELAQVLQNNWQQELGVRIEIVQQESKTVLDAMGSKNYQAGLTGYFYGIPAAEFILTQGNGDSPSNWTGWKNPEFNRAFDAAKFARSTEARFAAYDQMERLIQAEAPYAPLFYVNQCNLIHPSVRGWRDNPFYAIDWRDLWLEAPK